VTAGFAIYDTMRYINDPVATFAMGFAASMGSSCLWPASGPCGSACPIRASFCTSPRDFQGQVSDIERHAADARETKERK